MKECSDPVTSSAFRCRPAVEATARRVHGGLGIRSQLNTRGERTRARIGRKLLERSRSGRRRTYRPGDPISRPVRAPVQFIPSHPRCSRNATAAFDLPTVIYPWMGGDTAIFIFQFAFIPSINHSTNGPYAAPILEKDVDHREVLWGALNLFSPTDLTDLLFLESGMCLS